MPYGTIIADPPWAYQSASKHSRTLTGYVSYRDDVDTLYPVLTTKELCALPVGELAAPDSVLLLWATGPFMPEALEVAASWGFTFKTLIYWGKLNSKGGVHGGGVGYWFRGAAEPVIVACRGKSYRTKEPGLLLTPKLAHSAKPPWLHEVSERHFPGPYLELFGRRERSGWTVLGDEAPGYEGEDIRAALDRLVG